MQDVYVEQYSGGIPRPEAGTGTAAAEGWYAASGKLIGKN